MEAKIKFEHVLVAVEGDHDIHAMLEIATPEPVTGVSQAPLALVIDRSMHGDKLAYAKRSAEWLAGRLQEDSLRRVVRIAAPRPGGMPQGVISRRKK